MTRLRAVEEQPLEASAAVARLVYDRLVRLRRELKPRRAFVSGSASHPVVQNLVGSVQVSPSLVVDIEPKVPPNVNWQRAILDLLSTERFHAGGPSSNAERRRLPLADSFAALYADRLDIALRAAGPILVLAHLHRNRPVLAGRLDVSHWVRSRIVEPQRFPQLATELTPENEFSRAMAWVANALSSRVSDFSTRSRLTRLSREMRPGLPEYPRLDPGVSTRSLPPQWGEYTPAWTLACSVIQRLAPFHSAGVLDGLSLAVEPWPLLETLLARSLIVAARLGSQAGYPTAVARKTLHPFLEAASCGGTRQVEPDGLLVTGGEPIASFEAKYSSLPQRDHFYQATATAAAVGAPLAVLVYPGASGAQVWEMVGVTGCPRKVVTIGLDLYAYQGGSGEAISGQKLWDQVLQHALT